ncbi:DegT/DnrJ/EryC1/StrS family aminotransferase [Helicobacter pametensis]|uniref:DegT/DnrJ/EryC1/StrS family aminotransferase n=1 Tax=Helicobacter pametensis TaxID=95149 RepID=UPI00047F0AEA|nr:DegT/DnrJ/EryC1/StrS family aminotransferase [Helicobacter pametensis]
MVKFLDLVSQYRGIKDEICSTILEIMDKGAFVGGEYVERFEGELAKFLGISSVLGVGNGTDAIELALRALDLPKGSEVIIPANTFFGTLEGVVNAGLHPVFVDCGEDYCMDVGQIPSRITAKTSAILPVHLYGRMCDMESIMKIASDFGLRVIEDCAQSFGARISVFGEKRYAGSIGDVGCFSFYPGKNLGAYGDGGAIVTSRQEVYLLAQSLANHGRGIDKYEHLRIGRNSRLDGIQAGILSVKLRYIQEWNERRRQCAKLYNQLLEELKDSVITPKIDDWERSVWHLYVVRLRSGLSRDEFMKYLRGQSIECGIHYPMCLDQESSNAREWSGQILSLPMGEHLRDEDIEWVVKNIKDFLNKKRLS